MTDLLPVDLITETEWAAAVAVHNAQHNPTQTELAAKITLDSITGNTARSDQIVATVADAHQWNTILGHKHEGATSPRPALLDDRTPGAGDPRDPGTHRRDVMMAAATAIPAAIIITQLARGGW
jgi:hypothetical protein